MARQSAFTMTRLAPSRSQEPKHRDASTMAFLRCIERGAPSMPTLNLSSSRVKGDLQRQQTPSDTVILIAAGFADFCDCKGGRAGEFV